jgi:glycosyltransferase involved in cell wall biosynthesis
LNVAFLTTRLFDKPGSGGEVCTARLLQELTAAGHPVHVIGRGAAPAARDGRTVQYSAIGPLVCPFQALPRWVKLKHVLASLATGQASTVQRLAAGNCAKKVQHLLLNDAQPLHAVVVDHLQTYAWIAGALPGLPRPMLVMHNLESEAYAHSAREQRRHRPTAGWAFQAAFFDREAHRLQAMEDQALRHSAVVACLSGVDAQNLQRRAATLGIRLTIEVLPGFPITSQPPVGPATSCTPELASTRGVKRIGMLGTWSWAPNRAGLEWVLRHVLTQLPPDCELVIAGMGLGEFLPPAGVNVVGRVDDVAAFYASVDLVAIASLTGSGVQEKAIEAIGFGKPVVATAHALRGLAPGLPADVFVEDDPARFAQRCAGVATRATRGHDGASLHVWRGNRQRAYRAALSRCLDRAAAAR